MTLGGLAGEDGTTAFFRIIQLTQNHSKDMKFLCHLIIDNSVISQTSHLRQTEIPRENFIILPVLYFRDSFLVMDIFSPSNGNIPHHGHSMPGNFTLTNSLETVPKTCHLVYL